MTRNLKKSFENGLVKNLKANPKAFWAYVNGKIKSTSGVGTLKGQNDSMVETDSDKADVLSSFLATTFTQEDLTTIPVSEFEGEMLENIEFTKEEVLKRLKELDPGKSSGPDNIHPKMLKELATDISELLALFSETHWISLIFQIWKRVNVTPILKSETTMNEKTIRPLA